MKPILYLAAIIFVIVTACILPELTTVHIIVGIFSLIALTGLLLKSIKPTNK
jgi:hypothetical protein